MTPIIPESDFEGKEERDDDNTDGVYSYDIKFEIVLKDGRETIPGKAIMIKSLAALKTNKRKQEKMDFFDTNGTQINFDLKGIQDNEMEERFCVEMGGINSNSFFFGCNIRTNIPFSVLKGRTLPLYKNDNIYMKLHAGGFNHGVNWSTVGFFINKHPNFVNTKSVTQAILNKIHVAWYDDEETFDEDLKEKIKKTIEPDASINDFNPMTIPLIVCNNFVMTKDSNGEKIRSKAVTVMIPHSFYKVGTTLMDYLLLNACELNNYIPMGFKKENPTGFINIMKTHATWINDHRNIAIKNITTKSQFSKENSNRGNSLKEVLGNIEGVDNISYDSQRQQVNISTTFDKQDSVMATISKHLTEETFAFTPKIDKGWNSTGTTGSSKSSRSKYSEAMEKFMTKKHPSPTASVATSSGEISQLSGRSNPWKKIPRNIDFAKTENFSNSNDEDKQKTSQTTTSIVQDETTFTADSAIQQAVSMALRLAHEEHKQEIQAIQTMFDKKLTENNAIMDKRFDQMFALLTTTTVSESPMRKKGRHDHPNYHKRQPQSPTRLTFEEKYHNNIDANMQDTEDIASDTEQSPLRPVRRDINQEYSTQQQDNEDDNTKRPSRVDYDERTESSNDEWLIQKNRKAKGKKQPYTQSTLTDMVRNSLALGATTRSRPSAKSRMPTRESHPKAIALDQANDTNTTRPTQHHDIPLQLDNLLNGNAKEISSDKAKNDKTTPQLSSMSHNEWIGDTIDDSKPHKTIRVMFQNANNIGSTNPNANMNILVNEQLSTNVDVLGLTEHCINTKHNDTLPKMKASLRQQIIEPTFLQINSSAMATDSTYLPGGTAISLAGHISGRLDTNGSGGDALGRWSFVHLRRKDKKPLTIMSVYQVNAKPTNEIGITAWHQQRIMLDKAQRTQTPRQAFIQDLTQCILSFQQQHHEIIVGGDFNETSTKSTSGLLKLITQTGLIDAWNHRFPFYPEFNSYNRGSKRIDTILCSATLTSSIQAIGYSPFQWFTNSDHRAVYIDLSTQSAIDSDIDHPSSFRSRSIKSNDKSNVQVYVKQFYDHLIQNNSTDTINKITLLHATTDEVERFDKLITQAMESAESKCKRRRREFYSVNINSLRIKIAISKGVVHQLRQQLPINIPSFTARLQRANIQMPLHDNIQAAVRQLKELYNELSTVTKNSKTIRDEELSKRIHEKHAQGSSEHAKRLQSIKKGEAARHAWRVLDYLKNTTGQKQTLSQLSIPASWPHPDEVALNPTQLEDPKTCTSWKIVTDPQLIDHFLRLRNRGHFGQAQGTPFTETPLSELIDWTADTPFTDQILNGTTQIDSIHSIPQCQALLDACKVAETLDILPSHITEIELTGKMRAWRESTTTSPSGRHLGKYKALYTEFQIPKTYDSTMHDDTYNKRISSYKETQEQQKYLRNAILSMLNYCLYTGHVLERWKTIVNMMIFKEQGNFHIHKLRVIHIYEADFNLILAVKWRQLLQMADSTDSIHEGLFGGRPGREAQSLTFLEELKYDISFMARRSLCNFDNDATSCYDRIILSLASLIHRKYGMHRKVVAVHAKTLQLARFHLKTNTGISEQYYTHSATFPIFGSGQGSGNSPCIWLFISSTLCQIHQQVANGASFTNIQGDETVTIPIVGFVDDCTGTYNDFRPQQEDDLSTMMTKMQQDAQVWNDLLWCSGGKLELPKCSFHMLRFRFKPNGAPISILEPPEHPIHLQDSATSELIPIRPNRSDEPHKTLGHWKAPSSPTDNKQLQTLIEKASRTTNLIATAALSRSGAVQAYFGVYIASLKYVLPQCHFSQRQLNKAETKTAGILLAKCGYNRHIPLPIRYAPASYAGCGMIPWWVLQGEGQVCLFTKHWRSESIISKTLRIATSWCQWQAGISKSWLDDTITPLPHLEAKWCTSLRENLSRANIQILTDKDYVTPPERHNDVYIMEWTVNQSGLSNDNIKIVNYCRLHLHVTTVSELFDLSGKNIRPHIYNCRRAPWFDNTQMGPIQPRPSNHQIRTIWKPLCNRWRQKINEQTHIFGEWTHIQAPWRSRRQVPVPSPPQQASTHDMPPISVPLNEFTQTRSSRPKHICQQFGAYVQTLPQWEQFLLRHVVLGNAPITVAQKIKTSLEPSGTLRGILNHSFQRETASFGWSLMTPDGTTVAECHGPSPGPPSRSRADAWGALSIIRFLFHLHRHTNKPPTITSTTILSRNIKVIRILTSRPKYTNVFCNETLTPDWDVFEQIHHATHDINGSIKWTSLMEYKQQILNQDLTKQNKFTQQVGDTTACTVEFLQNRYTREDVSPFLPASKCIVIWNRTETIHKKLHLAYRDATLIPPVQKYLRTKYAWSDDTVQDIKWSWFQNAARSYKHASRNHLTKLIYNQLATPSRLKKQGGNHWANDTCPHCSLVPETYLHMIQCLHPEAVRFRQSILTAITRVCDKTNTPTSFKNTVLQAIRKNFEADDGTTQHTLEVQRVYTAQQQIGWSHLLYGRWSRQWRRLLHQSVMHQEPLKCSYNALFKKLIITIWSEQTDFWKAYQDARHSHDDTITRSRKHEEQRHATQYLFSFHQKVLLEHRGVYFPKDHQLFLDNSTCQQLTSYVNNYKDVIMLSSQLQANREQAQSTAIWKFPGFVRRRLPPATTFDATHTSAPSIPDTVPVTNPDLATTIARPPSRHQSSIQKFFQSRRRQHIAPPPVSTLRHAMNNTAPQQPIANATTDQPRHNRNTTRAHNPYKHSKWRSAVSHTHGFRKFFRPSV